MVSSPVLEKESAGCTCCKLHAEIRLRVCKNHANTPSFADAVQSAESTQKPRKHAKLCGRCTVRWEARREARCRPRQSFGVRKHAKRCGRCTSAECPQNLRCQYAAALINIFETLRSRKNVRREYAKAPQILRWGAFCGVFAYATTWPICPQKQRRNYAENTQNLGLGTLQNEDDQINGHQWKNSDFRIQLPVKVITCTSCQVDDCT